jgi:NADH-quinone oxidoreductase subunit H
MTSILLRGIVGGIVGGILGAIVGGMATAFLGVIHDLISADFHGPINGIISAAINGIISPGLYGAIYGAIAGVALGVIAGVTFNDRAGGFFSGIVAGIVAGNVVGITGIFLIFNLRLLPLNFESIYDPLAGPLPEGLAWLAFGLAGFLFAFIVINALLLLTALYTWFERRVIGRFQSRLGPNRWGPFGLLQPLADGVKLMTKEDVIPETADRPVFTLAPIVLLAPAFLVFAIIPFGENSFLGRLNVGVLFIIGITGVNTFGIFMGGWGSRNKFAMFGAMRGVAMLISYEVPMALGLTGVVILAGSLSLLDIVNSQGVIFLLVQPLGFLVFMAAASAEMSRAPFDMIESESELGAGYHTEYSGMKFAILQLSEFMAPLVTAAVATVLFLGGTRGFAPIPGQIWFLLKAFLVVFFLLWVRATWPRLRVDQIMGLAWKGLFPLALLNMFLVAIEVQVLQDPSTGALSNNQLWTMAAINWAVTIVSIVAIANILGQPRLRRATPVPSPLANMDAEAD